NEPVAANAVASIGLNPAAAGSALIGLSVGCSRPDTDRAGLRHQIENALRLTCAAPAAARQRHRRDNEIEYRTEFVDLRDISLST
ncbi:MAG: hypothetical protein ABI407_17765, partial [Bradyrhizobium sp.]